MQVKMVDLDTQMKIDALVDFAYDKTVERMNAIELAPQKSVYQTITMDKGKLHSFVLAYLNYYWGCFEGILFTRFLEEFNRMPTPSENSFIVDTIKTRFEKLNELCIDFADKKFKENS